MKILLHTCCGPCAIYPIEWLRQNDFDVFGFFYRNNIHPYTECQKRENTLKEYADDIDLKVIFQEGYNLEEFIQNVVYRESERCHYCYYDRLRATARIAKRGRFDYFTSSLLYSKFQKHDLIKSIGSAVAKTVGVQFFYHDFREGWQVGIAKSKERQMYRQQYCGCIYSEKERYFR